MARNFEELRKRMSHEAQAGSRMLVEEEIKAILDSLSAQQSSADPHHDKPTTETDN